MIKTILLSLFFIVLIIFPIQGQMIIKGKVLDDDSSLIQDAFIQLISNKDTLNAISNQKGVFHLNNRYHLGDTIHLFVSKEGFIDKETKIIVDKDNFQNLEIIMQKEDTILLDEVLIFNEPEKRTAGKITYTINVKDFLKTSNAETVLQSLPNVNVIEGIGIKLDGIKDVQIFIDGMESHLSELKNLMVSEIKNVDIISNPSASYGSEIKGAIININTRENKEHFFKGALTTSRSIRLNKWDVSPSFSYKSNKWISKIYFWHLNDKQKSIREVWRSNHTDEFYQFNYGLAKGQQEYLSFNNRFLLNEKSTIYLNSSLSGQIRSINSNGFYENTEAENYEMINEENYRIWNISSIYSYELNKTATLFLKVKYMKHQISNHSEFYSELPERDNVSSIFSNTEESTGEVVYEENSSKLFNRKLFYKVGFKSIFREFTYQTRSYNVSQNVQNFYLDMNYEFSNAVSVFSSLAYNFTQNRNIHFKQNYDYFLPTVSLLYNLSEKSKFHIDYSQRISRPASDKINPIINYLNPTNIIKGNENLDPQLRHFYELGFSSKIEKINFSAKLFNENISNAMVQTIEQENDTIIYSYENAGKANRYGLSLGINTKLFKLLNLNINTGIVRNSYESNTDASLLQKNEGYSFNGGFSLHTFLKEKYALSLSGFYNSPEYSLANKKTYPLFMSLSAERNFLKDQLSIKLTYFDVFGLYSGFKDKIKSNDFNQKIKVTNKLTNFSFAISYRFGKTFNDNYKNPEIHNNDIQLKK